MFKSYRPPAIVYFQLLALCHLYTDKRAVYTVVDIVSQNETPTQSLCDNYGKWTDFNHPFTVAFCNELWKKLLYNLPPHLKSIAALPCEIGMFN